MRRFGTGSILFLCLLALTLPAARAAGEESDEPPKLLGKCTVRQLDEEPFSEWFRGGYRDYTPNPKVLQALGGADQRGVEMMLFFGTWCGDSRRELPRILKLLDEIGFPEGRVELVAVDSGEGVHKRSPGGEEQGLDIYRVPTLVVRRDGKEIARLVEFPVLSLERDLLAILSDARYEPNYRSYPVIHRWLDEGLLADENVSAWGLANQVRNRVATEGELAAAARVLLERGDVAEAVKLMQVNCALYRESPRCFARLAEAQLRAGEPEAAREAAERAIRLNADPARLEELLDLLERSGQREE